VSKRYLVNILKRVANAFLFRHKYHIYKSRPDLECGKECIVCHRTVWWDHETCNIFTPWSEYYPRPNEFKTEVEE
jgi:hypothetical protein